MTTYRKLRGKAVKTVTTNPTDDAAEGQIWFNSTDNTFKSAVVGQAWSSGGPLSTGRYLSGSLGTQTAGVQIIGSTPTNVSNVEHYNGTGWSEETNYPAAGQAVSGAGTQTAGIAFGGSTPSQTANAFSYNGTAWTAANPLPYAANNIASCGLEKTNVIGAVGRDGSSGNSGTNKTVTFDGTNFANGPTINTTRMFNNSSGAGTGTAALIVGGFIDPSPNAMTNCEEYNGSSWTATGALNVATGFASAFGIQTNAVAQTNGSNYVATEAYDGSTWTTLPNMSVSTPGGLYGSSAGSTGDAGWVSSMGPALNATEEFNRTASSVVAGAWASGGTVPYTSRQNMSFGTQTAAISCGGYVSSTLDTSVSYDGTSYSGTPALNVAARMGGVAGTQAAGLQFGGIQPPGTYNANMQSWNGSSWSNSPYNLNSGSYGIMGCGTSTAALRAGGENPAGGAAWNLTEEYDGSGWTAGNTIPDGKYEGAGNGVQTSALIAGGSPSGTSTYEYDGTNWTAGGALTTSRPGTKAGSAGVSSSSNIVFGGNAPPGVITVTEGYDGTAWSTRPSLGTGRGSTTGNGTATAGLMVSGGPPGSTTTVTEEFTGETTALNVKTLTQA